jgi:L,D-peptidoglycan transpeptidase YkuD (ErfK/YbiS/YcfS/YnhG family)
MAANNVKQKMQLNRNMLLKKAGLYCASFSLFALSSVVVNAQADEVIKTEQKLLTGLTAIHSNQLDKALLTLSELGEEYPKYKLAHLLKADLLAAKAGQFDLIQKMHQKHSDSVNSLIDEAEVRWSFAKEDVSNSSEFDEFVLKSAHQKNIILVSLKESRLYLYQRNKTGQMTQVADYYVTMGRKGSGKQKEGDLRTPIGVYHMVDLLPGSTLPDLYGVGALPLNYPNQWDKMHGKTGSGIWLHGVPSDTYIRAPKASRGCVVLNNTAMQRILSEYDLPFSTPVVIIDESKNALKFVEDKQRLLRDVRAWLKDNNHSVDWNSVSVYRYPNENNLFYITFPGKDENSLVQQFWKRDGDGDWKVVIESQDAIKSPSKST